MTGPYFIQWLAAMKATGRAATKAEALAMLGYGPDQAARYARDGAPLAVGLACAALLAGLPPYGSNPAPSVSDGG